MNEQSTRSPDAKAPSPIYETPKITVMDEKDVLQAFQITSAGSSWWSM